MAKKPKIQTRKPPTAEALSQFVAGSQPSARATRSTNYTRKTGEKAGENLRRVTLYFPLEIYKQARIASVNADVALSELVVGIVSKAIGSK